MNVIVLLISTLILSSCGKGRIPVILPSKDSKILKVEASEYKNFVEYSFEKSMQDVQTNPNSSLYLDTIVIGLAMDLRVGLRRFNLSPHNSFEFHLKKVQNWFTYYLSL